MKLCAIQFICLYEALGGAKNYRFIFSLKYKELLKIRFRFISFIQSRLKNLSKLFANLAILPGKSTFKSSYGCIYLYILTLDCSILKNMFNKNSKRVPLQKESVLLIKGLIIGKVLTLAVVGGLLWWLWPRQVNTNVYSSSNTVSDATDTSNFQTVANVPTGSFDYGGSPAWAPIRLLVDSQIQNARPELQLRYVNPANSSPSSSSSFEMLLDGELDFAQFSRPLTEEEYATAQQRGITLQQSPVAVDAIAVVVNPSLQVPGLTVDQLQQIYQGKITNWSQVGGPDLAITPFSLRSEDRDTLLFPQQDQPFGSSIQYVSSTTEALRKVSNTPGGIYYGSAGTVVPQCSVKPLPLGETSDQLVPPYRGALVSPQQCPNQRNQINAEAFKDGSYPLINRLSVVTKQNNGQEENAGEAYTKLLLTDKGQNAIEQAGYVSLEEQTLATP